MRFYVCMKILWGVCRFYEWVYRCKGGFVESMKLVDSMSGFVGSMKGFVNSVGVLRCVIPVV